MAFGIKVSKPGTDVNTAGTNDLFLDTQYPLLKIKQSGTGSLTVADGSSDSDVIDHNLGYIPLVMVFGQTYTVNGGVKSSNYTRYPYAETVSQIYYSVFEYTATTTQLTISGSILDDTSYSGTFSYFYYIYYNED